MKIIGVTQARIGSSRLPRKVLLTVNDKTLLEYHLERAMQSKLVNKWIVATTDEPESYLICDIANKLQISSYKGSLNDVLDRFYQSVKNENPDFVVRITSDCPLIDPELVDEIVTFVQENNCDYGSNGLIENYPDGQDVEVFKFSALKLAWENALLKSEREHVTPYIRNNSDFNNGNLFKAINFPCDSDFSKIRMTVDEQRDFDLMEILIHQLGTDKTWLTYTNFIIENDLTKVNGQIIRNEGLIKSLKND